MVSMALAGSLPGPWDVPLEGLDVAVISSGEAVDPEDHLAEGKFTVIDIGAAWCAPCHVAAGTLRDYLYEHDDVAVRVVDLPETPSEASVAPAMELLGGREMIPYLIVYAPDGRVVYRGHRVQRALKRIDRKR